MSVGGIVEQACRPLLFLVCDYTWLHALGLKHLYAETPFRLVQVRWLSYRNEDHRWNPSNVLVTRPFLGDSSLEKLQDSFWWVLPVHGRYKRVCLWIAGRARAKWCITTTSFYKVCWRNWSFLSRKSNRAGLEVTGWDKRTETRQLTPPVGPGIKPGARAVEETEPGTEAAVIAIPGSARLPSPDGLVPTNYERYSSIICRSSWT